MQQQLQLESRVRIYKTTLQASEVSEEGEGRGASGTAEISLQSMEIYGGEDIHL